MVETKCPQCGYSYYFNPDQVVFGLAISCWHCLTCSTYTKAGIFQILKPQDALCLRCGLLIAEDNGKCECSTPLLKITDAAVVDAQVPLHSRDVRGSQAHAAPDNHDGPGGLDEQAYLGDSGCGDAACAEAGQQMLNSLRTFGHEHYSWGDGMAVGNNV